MMFIQWSFIPSRKSEQKTQYRHLFSTVLTNTAPKTSIFSRRIYTMKRTRKVISAFLMSTRGCKKKNTETIIQTFGYQISSAAQRFLMRRKCVHVWAAKQLRGRTALFSRWERSVCTWAAKRLQGRVKSFKIIRSCAATRCRSRAEAVWKCVSMWPYCSVKWSGAEKLG